MPFVETPRELPGLRTSQEQANDILLWNRQQEAKARNIELAILLAFAFLVVAATIWLYRRRARIAAAADKTAVEGAALGLTAFRRCTAAARRFVARVVERADQK